MVVDVIEVSVKCSPLDPEVHPLFAPSLCSSSSSHVLGGAVRQHPRVTIMSSLLHTRPDGGCMEVCVSDGSSWVMDLLGSDMHWCGKLV